MTNTAQSGVVLKLKIQFMEVLLTKFFCSICKIEITDPRDHTKFRTITHWRGDWRVMTCIHCGAELREVVTPVVNFDNMSTMAIESFST